MNAKELKTEIERRQAALAPALREIAALERQHRKARSLEWIEANGVRRSDIEFSNAGDLPYFGHVVEFGKWLAAHSHKRWAEWNGRIYSAGELMAGRMDVDAPGEADDVAA